MLEPRGRGDKGNFSLGPAGEVAGPQIRGGLTGGKTQARCRARHQVLGFSLSLYRVVSSAWVSEPAATKDGGPK